MQEVLTNQLNDKQKRLLIFIKYLNQYAVKYTSISIMIEGEPLDIDLIKEILSQNEYSDEDKEYLTKVTQAFFELIREKRRVNVHIHNAIAFIWKEYTELWKMTNVMNTSSNFAVSTFLEAKFKKYFENTY